MVAAPTWSGTTTVARPMVIGRRNRKVPAIPRKVKAWAKKSGASCASCSASIRSTDTQIAAAPASTSCSSDATSQIRPTTLWSPVPRNAASPVAAGAGAVGSEDAGAAAGASSVTVIQAPGTRDGWCSGI